MSNRRALFSEADAARALRAAAKAGVAAVVEIKPDGTIRIIPAGVDSGDSRETPSDGERIIDL